MPSIAPLNVRVTKLHFGELKIRWNPIPQQYIHGLLQGYRVYYTKYPYWYGSKTVNSSSPDDIMLVVTGLKVAHQYRISVAAFTSIGTGPRSPYVNITTGTAMGKEILFLFTLKMKKEISVIGDKCILFNIF